MWVLMLIISLLLVMCRVASSSSTLNIILKYQHNNPVDWQQQYPQPNTNINITSCIPAQPK